MIISFNSRENHYKGKRVAEWYGSLPKTERSRKIVDALYAHIQTGGHMIEQRNEPSYLHNYRGGSDIW
jgi:hypothetical protein